MTVSAPSGTNSAPPALSVLIRAHDPDRIDELARAFQSVWTQSTTDTIEVLLCTDGKWPELTEVALLARAGVDNMAPNGPRLLRHLATEFDGDSRVHLLKLGVEAAHGDFVGVLDFDDVWHKNAATRLVARARETGASVTFGAADLALFNAGEDTPFRTLPYGSFPFQLTDLLRHNVAPFNSFITQRAVLVRHIPSLPELVLFEDYYLLLSALSEGAAAWLDDPSPVCEYRVDVSRQATKYNDAIAASWMQIEALKARLSFSVPGRDLLRDHATDTRRAADLALLAAVPKGRDGAMQGVIEQTIALGNGVLCIGWCADLKGQSADVPAIFLEDATGEIIFAPARWERRDVNSALQIDSGRAGFAVVMQSAPVAAWAVVGRRKYQLDNVAQSEAQASLLTKLQRRLWRLRNGAKGSAS